ncbi:MAG: hypothetical protein GY847_03245 [Proteobacteria bacterium]|nr:hypothetical protein [Pseudomonadota bacterium]
MSIVGDASPSSSPLLLNPSDLSTDAWLALFNLSLSKPGGILLSRALRHVRRTPSPPAGGTEGGRHYLIPDLIAQIETDDRANESTKEAIANRLEAAHHDWGIFRQTRPEPGRGDGHQNLAETFIPGLHLVDLSRVPSPIFRKMEASQGQERVQKASRERELQIGD